MNKFNKRSTTFVSALFLILSLIVGTQTYARTWQPDRFLAGYEETTIEQPDDYSGQVVCTVVRHTAPVPCNIGVLYVHGYNDYFFQAEEGDRFAAEGYNFYAVDLRKYGRSLRDEQKPYECRSVSEYYADIDSALVIMKNAGIDRVVLMGHSTGGLVVASYMNHDPNPIVKAVILNSPFLDWNMTGMVRSVGIPVVSWIGGWWPRLSISQGDGTAYAESLLSDYHGEWHYDTNLKTVHPRKVTAGWIRAITGAQKALREYSAIMVPVLLLHSDKSVYGDEYTEEHRNGDAVLNVQHIADYGMQLGPYVTEDIIAGGLHDLALSAPAVRAQFYKDIFSWLGSLGLFAPHQTR